MLADVLKNKVLAGYGLTKEDAALLAKEELESLCKAADSIRSYFCGNRFDICTILNTKSGRCSEDCKYCAQSSHFHTQTESYELLETNAILEEAKKQERQGIGRISLVTSGRNLSKEEIEKICESYYEINRLGKIRTCASHGLLTGDQLAKLKAAGVSRYHNNLETSRRYFASICTTHTYDDKIKTIQAAREAGLSVCSGGIIGLGETMEDRIDMALTLRELCIKSIPINILNPIPGTPLGGNKRLSEEEIQRSIAVFRFINPDAFIRMAGGRGLLTDQGRCLLESGANAAISGDMLTTAGISTKEDMKMIQELGFVPSIGE